MVQSRIKCSGREVPDTVTVNGTAFVVCRKLTPSELHKRNLELGLGLGLGIGIPVLLLLILCLYVYYRANREKRMKLKMIEKHGARTTANDNAQMLRNWVNQFFGHHVMQHIAEILLLKSTDQLPGVTALIVSREAAVVGGARYWVDMGVPADQRRLYALFILFKAQAAYEKLPLLVCFEKWRVALLDPPLPASTKEEIAHALQSVHNMISVPVVIA